MWTITEKQIAAIADSMKAVAEKIIGKPASTESVSKSEEAAPQLGKPEVSSVNKQVSQSNNETTQGSTTSGNSSISSEGTQSTNKEIVVLPCERIEVTSLNVGDGTSLPTREIISSKWLTEDNIEIKSSLPQRNVKIEIETRGIPDGDNLDIKITNKKDQSQKTLTVKVNGNKALSNLFSIEDDWLDQILQIKIDKI